MPSTWPRSTPFGNKLRAYISSVPNTSNSERRSTPALRFVEEVATTLGLAEANRIREWNLMGKLGTAIAACQELVASLERQKNGTRCLVRRARGAGRLTIPSMDLGRRWSAMGRRPSLTGGSNCGIAFFDIYMPDKLGVPIGTDCEKMIAGAFSKATQRLKFAGLTPGSKD